MVTKYTKDNVVEWYEKYKEIGNISKVSDHFGVGATTISRLLKKYGFRGPVKIKRYSEKDAIKWNEKYQELRSMTATSEYFGFKRRTMGKVLNRFGFSSIKEIKRYCDDDAIKWYEKYKELGTIEKVSNYFGVSDVTIRKYLEKLNFREIEHMPSYSDEDVKKWYDKYKELKSLKNVADYFNISYVTVQSRFAKSGISASINKNTVNHTFFDINSPESFYWAGFMAADGCVFNYNGKCVSLALNHKDVASIERFKQDIEFSGKIHTFIYKDGKYKRGDRKSICVRSDGLFDGLKRFNVIPNKTLVYKFPKWIINHSLVNHYIRGYNDGDGSFYFSKNKNRNTKQLYISICGTYDFIFSCYEVLSKNCNIDKKFPRKYKNIYILGYGGNKLVGKIKDFLYNNSNNLYMERKFNTAYEPISIPNRINNKYVVGTNTETGATINLDATVDGVKFGFQPTLISACCRGERKTHKGYTWKYAQE